jgi:hypothetical protein
MKKFFTFFAMLSFFMSALADEFVPSIPQGKAAIFYEKVNTSYDHLYTYGGDGGELAGVWQGAEFGESIGTSAAGNLVYAWYFDENAASPEKIIFHNNGSDTDRTESTFLKNGYYIDGVYDHTVGKTGYTIYYDNSGTDWWEEVYIYTWHKSKDINSGWKSHPMEFTYMNNIWEYHVSDEDFSNVIFHDGKTDEGNSHQTVDVKGVEDGKIFVADGQIGEYDKYKVKSFDAFLEVTDGENFSWSEHKVVGAHYYRTFDSQWGTLCLPFDINDASQFRNDVVFFQFQGVDKNMVMHFTRAPEFIQAGQPVIFKSLNFNNNEGSFHILSNFPSVTTSPLEAFPDEPWNMVGTFESKTGSGLYYFLDQMFYYGTGNITMPAYRAWFTGPAPQGGAPLRFEVDDTEGLQFVEQEDGSVKVYYDLQGRKLDSTRKGLVIENGKIIMVK